MKSLFGLCFAVLADQLLLTTQQSKELDNSQMGYRLADIHIAQQELMFNIFVRPPAGAAELYESAGPWPYKSIRYRDAIGPKTELNLEMTVRNGTAVWTNKNYPDKKKRLCKMSKDDENLGMPNLVKQLIGLNNKCRQKEHQVQELDDGLNEWTLTRLIPVREHFNITEVEVNLFLTLRIRYPRGDSYTHYIYNGTMHLNSASDWINKQLLPNQYKCKRKCKCQAQ